MVNNNEFEYILSGPSRDTNRNKGSNSNLNSRPCNAILPMVTSNEIEYFIQAQAESDRKASVEITK